MINSLPKKISLENDLRDELEAAEARITELERQVNMWADACNTAISQREAAEAHVAELKRVLRMVHWERHEHPKRGEWFVCQWCGGEDKDTDDCQWVRVSVED